MTMLPTLWHGRSYRKQYAYSLGRHCYGYAPYEDCPYKDDPWKTWWQKGWKAMEREQRPRPAWMTIGKAITDAIKRRGQKRAEPYAALNESATQILRGCQEKLRLAAPKIRDLKTREAVGGLAFMSDEELAVELAEFRSQATDLSPESFVRWRVGRV